MREPALQSLGAVESHSLGLLSMASEQLAAWMRGWGPAEVAEGAAAASPPPPAAPVPCLAWHPHLQRCAVSTGGDSIRVFDLFEVDSGGAEGFSVRPFPWQRALRHDLQRGVSCVAWQPCRGTVLAVGCRGGVCLWGTADEREVWRPSHGQITRHEAADAIWLERNHGSDQPFLLAPPGTAGGAGDARWFGQKDKAAGGAPQAAAAATAEATAEATCGPVVRVRQFLNSASHRAESVNEAEGEQGAAPLGSRGSLPHTSSVAWSPDGQFLATCTEGEAAVLLWELGSGRCTPLRVALDGVDRGYSLLRWSPDGRHLFAASTANRFRLWSTATWTSAVWNTPCAPPSPPCLPLAGMPARDCGAGCAQGEGADSRVVADL